MKKIFVFVLFACFVHEAFSQNWKGSVEDALRKNMNDELWRWFGAPEIGLLSTATVHPDAWIGNWVDNWGLEDEGRHFYGGLSFSAGMIQLDFLKFLKYGSASGFGAYAAPVFRMGGFGLPFDLAVSGAYVPFELDDRQISVIEAVADFRYRLVREGYGVDFFDSADNLLSDIGSQVFIPSVSFGVGVGFFSVETYSFLTDQAFAEYDNSNPPQKLPKDARGDVDLDMRFQTYTFYFSFQASKKIVLSNYFREFEMPVLHLDNPPVYWIPYIGFKMAIGESFIIGQQRTSNFIDASGASQPDYQLKIIFDDKLQIHPIVFLGLGTHFFQTAMLNIGFSYDIQYNIPAAQFSLGVSK